MKRTVTFIFLINILCSHSRAQSCSDLFISEYIEGTSFNKVLEIYNPTTGTVQMDGYQLLLYSNGNDTASFTFKLHGPLASHQAYVLAHPQADSVSVIPLADTTTLACNWNGDDAVALVNNNVGDTIDIIGVIGEDPGTEWTVSGGGTTKEHTLIRTIDTQEGTTDWILGSTQWNSFPQNDFSNLGIHAINTCPVTSPEISISTDSTSIPENTGSFPVKVYILNPNGNATAAEVSVSGGTATQGTDYFFTNQIVTFPSNNSDPISIAVEVVSDGFSEPDESVEISLQNPTNGATIAAPLVVVKIIDDDGLSIPTNVSGQAVVYPNPATDILHIQSASSINEVRLENMLGEEIIRLSPSHKEQWLVQLDKVPPGIYIVKIYTDAALLIKKISKK